MTTNKNGIINGDHDSSSAGANARAEETESLLQLFISQIKPFLQRADEERNFHESGKFVTPYDRTSLVHPDSTNPSTLHTTLSSHLELSNGGIGQDGMRQLVQTILQYSVNPSAPGFLDKLYSAPLAPGIAAELLLAVLNTNVHVYQVSPVLTLVEKHVTKSLAKMFGFRGPRAGGVGVQGGSASNLTSITIARNTLFPETKVHGNRAVEKDLVLFTSAHGHYSIEKAAQALGFGSASVIAVPVDAQGRMRTEELERLVVAAENKGQQPFYVNGTAGSTVLGSFDPFVEIAAIAKRHGMWFHVDGAWGGSFVFSDRPDLKARLKGTELADSIAINPHKMLGVPVTCSFLLGQDMRQFQTANTLKAGYLFHDDHEGGLDDETIESREVQNHTSQDDADWTDSYDLADLTLQCGRRGDALKLFLCWQYYGTQGYAEKINSAYDLACHLTEKIQSHPDLLPVLVSGKPPSCLQVCFYFTPSGKFTYGLSDKDGYFEVPRRKAKFANNEAALRTRMDRLGKLNSRITSLITKSLISKGFMVDFAPALEGQGDKGSFFRVVLNISTIRETVDLLVSSLVESGHNVIDRIKRDGGYEGSGI